MSELDEAMLLHVRHIVLEEGRPFTYFNFLSFDINGKAYNMKHGTFRNKVYKLRKTGVVEASCQSIPSFYTLKGVKFGKSVTSNHTMVNNVNKNNPIYRMLQDLHFDRQSIHDIRLKLKVPNIWNTLKDNPCLDKNEKSKDILFPSYSKDNALIRVIIHKTDTVSIIMGCSLEPISLDHGGIIRFYTLLTRMEEKIRTYVNSYCSVHNKEVLIIPDIKNGLSLCGILVEMH